MSGALCGIEPIWASEVEPYPIAVTKSRFPNMKHLGDISKINGAEIEPVDIITFGSPCQDLSVAGKRAGLKHEDNGDDETTRSGLFIEAVRIIKEMREKTNGEYPRFAVWENVPGAFSSNKGEDFRIVLEELIKIVEPSAVMPEVPRFGWAYADSYCGNGWSLAYRVLDAQYWGVPQRRRRIYLVADFGGQCAREILFKREGLRGYFRQGRTPRQTASTDAQRSVGTDDREGKCRFITFEPGIAAREGGHIYEGVSGTLRAIAGDNQMAIAYSVENHPNDSRVKIDKSGKVQSLTGRMGTGGGNVPMVMEPKPFCKGSRGKFPGDAPTYKDADVANTLNVFDLGEARANELIVETVALESNGQRPSHKGDGYLVTNKSYTLNATEQHAVAYNIDPLYIVRRLTPTECARLQGFADRWGDIDIKTDLTDAEYRFWLDVRNTHAAINGKQVKEYTKAQMLTWYNKLNTDSAEYKLWGNGIALPTALYVIQGIAEAMKGANND